jgi:excisionase family DNA binding protein
MTDSPLFTRPEVAAYLRLSLRQVDRLIATGELRSLLVGIRRLVRKSECDRFLNVAERRGRVA